MTARFAIGAAVLVCAVVLAYLPALGGSFQFDDYGVIVDNPQVHGLAAWWQSMPGIRPLLKLSYALNWSLSPQAAGFHAFNLAVHVLNVLMVWALAAHWLRALAPGVAQPLLGAAFVALLFALHPAATEAVTYVSGRSVSLMAFFYLGALWLHAKAGRHAAPLSALAFALALCVRETAVTLPVALWLLAWFRAEPTGETLRGLRWHGLVLLAAAIAALAWPGYDRFFQYSLQTRGAGPQLLGQLEAHAHLFWHSLVGLRTNIDPDLRVPAGWSAEASVSAAAMLAAVGLALASRRRWPWLGFGIAWYLLQLAPGNSLLPRLDLANDRHLYLALPGVALVLVVPLLSLRRPWLSCAAIAGLAMVMAHASFQRNLEYRDEVSLWTATVADSPGKARPWSNLGWALQMQGDAAGARQAYECALAMDPGHQQAVINLSLLPRPGVAAVRPDGECHFARLRD